MQNFQNCKVREKNQLASMFEDNVHNESSKGRIGSNITSSKPEVHLSQLAEKRFIERKIIVKM